MGRYPGRCPGYIPLPRRGTYKSVPERIQLVEDIWDSIAAIPEAVALTDEQKAELDRRLDAYHRNPDEGSPWSVVQEPIFISLGTVEE